MEVKSYATHYNITDNVGYVIIEFVNGRSTKWIRFKSLPEYQIILQILQSNDKVFFGKRKGELYLATEAKQKDDIADAVEFNNIDISDFQ